MTGIHICCFLPNSLWLDCNRGFLMNWDSTSLLTARPWAERGSCYARVFFCFFSFLCHQTQTSADDVFINQSQAKLPLGQMSSPNDVIISQLQAISQLFSSYLPSGKFCLVRELNIHSRGEIIGPKSLGVGRQDICKDKECKLGPVAGY